MKPPFNYILFDWDGTLSNTLPAWFEAHRLTLQEKYNISLSKEEVIEKMLVSPRGLAEFKIDNDEYFAEIYKYVEQNFHKIELHNEVIDTLEELKKRGKTIAIVTSQWRRFVEETLHFLNFSHFFSGIIAGDDVVNFKPHAEPIEKAITMLNAQKDETIMIGDSDADICAARNAGVKSVWFHPPENLHFYPHEHFAHLNPDFTIRSMKELLEIVK